MLWLCLCSSGSSKERGSRLLWLRSVAKKAGGGLLRRLWLPEATEERRSRGSWLGRLS